MGHQVILPLHVDVKALGYVICREGLHLRAADGDAVIPLHDGKLPFQALRKTDIVGVQASHIGCATGLQAEVQSLQETHVG